MRPPPRNRHPIEGQPVVHLPHSSRSPQSLCRVPPVVMSHALLMRLDGAHLPSLGRAAHRDGHAALHRSRGFDRAADLARRGRLRRGRADHDRLLRDAVRVPFRRDREAHRRRCDGGIRQRGRRRVGCRRDPARHLGARTAAPTSRSAVRIGLSTGDVLVEAGDYHGAPVVEAARLCGVAEGGQIFAADVVSVLAGSRGGHSFAPVGSLELKGLPPLGTVEVMWTAPPPDVPMPLGSSPRSTGVRRA